MDLRYSIYAFRWVKESNSFFADSPVPTIHPIDRKQFYIINKDSGGFRRFRWVKDDVSVPGIGDGYTLFESEDNIKCYIKIFNNQIMKDKVYTLIEDQLEYVTSRIKTKTGDVFKMKTSNSESWVSNRRNKKLITATDSGDNLSIRFGYRDVYDDECKVTHRFDYEQAYQLYCFLDFWHKSQLVFDIPEYVDKKGNVAEKYINNNSKKFKKTKK